MPKVIAITGKGGAGKTMLAAMLIRLLSREKGAKVLAIDADSSISLPYALGRSIPRTLSDIRSNIIEDPAQRKDVMGRHIRAVVGDILDHGDGYDLLVMGRSEGPGCYCGINDLLKYGIELLSKEYDVTIVDGEAGPEQINRRVLQNIDTLIIVTDTSRRSFQAAAVIQGIAGADTEGIKLGEKGLVINRLKESSELVNEHAQKIGIRLFGTIPEDKNITEYDLLGKPIIDIPDTSPSIEAVRVILKDIMSEK